MPSVMHPIQPPRAVPLWATVIVPVAAVLAAMVIVAADVVLDIPNGIGMLFVIVLLLCCSLMTERGVVIVALTGMFVSVAHYLLDVGPVIDVQLVRPALAIVTIAITGGLAAWQLRSQARLAKQARLLDLTHDAIVVRGFDNNIVTYWNRGAQALYGWPAEEAIGRRLPDVVTTMSPLSQEEMARRLEADGYAEGDLYRAGHDGRMRTVASRWALDHDKQGRPVAVMETDSDVSERRQAQRSLAAARRDLAQVSRVAILAEMTAAIAHEINQPLSTIVTNGEVCLRLLDQPSLDREGLREAVADFTASGWRAGEIIKRLRALFGRSHFAEVPLDINNVIRHAAILAERPLRDHHIALRVDLAHGLPKVLGDGIQLEQVLINLLHNGAQAVAHLNDPCRRSLFVRSWASGDNVFVAVDDTGEGISPDAEKRLFEPFFTTRKRGLGMGLRISRSIVESHGGTIRAMNRSPGPGARFEFSLPALRSEAAVAPAAAAG